MHVAADAIEHQNPLLFDVELGTSPPLPTRLMHILPDPEHLVDDATGADLEFVVSVGAGDKDFEVVLLVNLRVAFGERTPDVGFFGGETEIEVLVIPEKAYASIEPGGRASDNVDERGRGQRMPPAGFIETAVDVDGRAGAITNVTTHLISRNHDTHHRSICRA